MTEQTLIESLPLQESIIKNESSLPQSEPQGQQEFKSAFSKEALDTEIANLDQQNQILQVWVQAQKKIEEKYKNKLDAFRAIDANKSELLEADEFNAALAEFSDIPQLKEKQDEIFKLILQSGGAGLNQDDWTHGWIELVQQFDENQHRLSMLKQKLDFLAALQSKASTEVKSKRLEYLESPQENIPTNNTAAYNLLDRFRGTQSLEDFSNIIQNLSVNNNSQIQSQQQSSPFRRSVQPTLSASFNFDVKHKQQTQQNQRIDALFSTFRTPQKQEQEYSQVNQSRVSFISLISTLLPKQAQPPPIKYSPYRECAQNSIKSLGSSVQKIQKSMDANLGPPQSILKVNKQTAKRRDDLDTFITQIGLGKYKQPPQVTISLGPSKQKPSSDTKGFLINYQIQQFIQIK